MGKKFVIDIEGTLVEWDEPTIATEQIAELGGWDPSLGVVLIDLKTQDERTLQPGAVVELKPGQGFSKKSLQTRSNPNTIQIRKYLEHKQTPCRWLPSNFPSWTGGDQGVVDQKGRNRPQGRGLWPAWRSTTPVPSCPGGELKE